MLFDVHDLVPGAIQVLATEANFTGEMSVRGNEATKNGGGERVTHSYARTAGRTVAIEVFPAKPRMDSRTV